ncbi:MAG: hypothetical protein AAGA59_02060 [Actinomycetota bacterium]
MAIEQEVLRSAVEVILPIVGTGAVEAVGEEAVETAADGLKLAVARVWSHVRDRVSSSRPNVNEVIEALREASEDPAIARDLIVLAREHIMATAGRDLYQSSGDGAVQAGPGSVVNMNEGDITNTDVGSITAPHGQFRFGSRRG